MQDVKTALEDFKIDEKEILTLLEREQLFDAVRILEQKTPLNLETIMSLIGALKNREEKFVFHSGINHTSLKVSYENEEGEITVRLTDGNGVEKIVEPNDRDWLKVKKILGHQPEIIEYEKYFRDQLPKSSKKSSVFVEESPFAKSKFVLLIVLLLFLIYFFYQKFLNS